MTTLKTFINPESYSRDVKFSEVTIDGAMCEQASLYAHYSSLYAEAQFQLDSAKQTVDLCEAKLDLEVRDELLAEGAKITEGIVTARIHTNPKYVLAVKRKNEAAKIAHLCKSALEALAQKRDMLIQVSSNIRNEKKGDPRLMELPGGVDAGEAILSKLSRD